MPGIPVDWSFLCPVRPDRPYNWGGVQAPDQAVIAVWAGTPPKFLGYADTYGQVDPSGYKLIGTCDSLGTQEIVIYRTGTSGEIAGVSLTDQRMQVLADYPSTAAPWPAAPGKSIVGTWIFNPFSRTGWAHHDWREEAYDYNPDGIQTVPDPTTGGQRLEITAARSLPGFQIVPIPLTTTTFSPPTPTQQPPQPQPPEGPPPGGTLETLDEIGQLGLDLAAILAAIKYLTTQGGQPPPKPKTVCDDPCAIELVKAIGRLGQDLKPIVSPPGPGAPAPPIDLSAIVAVLEQILAAIASAQAAPIAIPPAVLTGLGDLTCICQALQDIARQLTEVDLSHLNKAADDEVQARHDRRQAVTQWLEDGVNRTQQTGIQ